MQLTFLQLDNEVWSMYSSLLRRQGISHLPRNRVSDAAMGNHNKTMWSPCLVHFK